MNFGLDLFHLFYLLRQGYLCEKVTGGLQSIAVRMPSHPIGRAILQYIDMPIAAPSANVSGRPSPQPFNTFLMI